MGYKHIKVPDDGERIEVRKGVLAVPPRPVIPYIEGDGIGIDITPVMKRIVDAAVGKAYGDGRQVVWMEVYAGEKATAVYGKNEWLPEETLCAMRDHVVSIKGPLTTPVGGGIRSLNVALRQRLDLYACIRPIRYFDGIVSPLRNPEKTDMVVFRENTEDIYAGIEFPKGSDEATRLLNYLVHELGVTSIRFPETSALGVKPVSEEGSKRLIRRALQYAAAHGRTSVTLVHKGNIMKYTEGAFREWGYELAREEFGAEPFEGGPWHSFQHPRAPGPIVVKDMIADNFLQQCLIKPQDFDVIATLNLNGDYISDALAAQVGGIGIAPGGNVSDHVAIFEATHGTAPKHAGKDEADPGSVILSAEMMLRHLGWAEAADLMILGMERTIRSGRVTYDLARGAEQEVTVVSSSGFGNDIVSHIRAA